MKSVKKWLCLFPFLIAMGYASDQCLGKNSVFKNLNSHGFTSKWLEKNQNFNDSCENPSNSIMNFLEDQIEVLPFAKYEKLVFVFGAEHTNKTTLILFLADADLEAIETSPNSGQFVFVDRDGPLNQYHANIDPDLIPDLIPNRERGLEFYVMPDPKIVTSDVAHDITGTHITQRLLKFAVGVKFLLVIDYLSVKDVADASNPKRDEIKQVVRHTTNLIKDLDKYNNSFALVVTHYTAEPNHTDARDYVDVINVLLKVRDELEKEMNQHDTPEEERRKISKDIRCIDIVRYQHVDPDTMEKTYPKIGIFRLANQTGMVRDMEYLQKLKFHIRAIIQENCDYIPKEDVDFFYSVQDESKNYIPELIKIGQQRILEDISNINFEINDFHEQFEKRNFEIKQLYDTMTRGYEIVSQISTIDPRNFVKQILEAADILGIEISNEVINTILKHIEFIDFMEELQNIEIMKRFQVDSGLEKTKRFLEESIEWYNFLMDLHDILSQYEIQKNVIDYEDNVTKIFEMSAIHEHEKKNVTDIGLKQLLDGVGSTLPSNIESLTVNFYKLRSLENVLQRTMMDQATPFCSPGKIEVRGYNIKISSYNEMNCTGNITFIEIFAMNKVFIDDDIEKTGDKVQLFIIAPTWEIIGNRQFILNGKDADPHKPPKASDGYPPGLGSANGVHGFPGNPGGPAGCFLGIADKYVDDKNLKIFLNGGHGGPGQDGGHGTYFKLYFRRREMIVCKIILPK